MKEEYKHFKPPFLLRKGKIVQPYYGDIADKINPIEFEKEKSLITLTKSVLTALGFHFEYDKFKKCECAKNGYMNLWLDADQNEYFILAMNSKIYIRYLYEFQCWFCFLFCERFKAGYNFHLLDYIIDLDREQFRILNEGH